MYTGLSNLGLNSISSVFSPTNLFSNNEQGFLFVNDISTMYQDSAGTTPAALEQPVGLWLDSKQGTAWRSRVARAVPTLAAFGTTPPTVSSTAFLGEAAQAVAMPATAGGFAVTRASGEGGVSEIIALAGALLRVRFRYALSRALTGSETITIYATGSSATDQTQLTSVSPAGVWVDSAYLTDPTRNAGVRYPVVYAGALTAPVTVYISAYEADDLPGNHATQPTSANRPTLKQDAKGNYYVHFNGTNQWMQTGSIDFTGTDKTTVFAGATKLSDAAAGIILELGNAGLAANPGSLSLGSSGSNGTDRSSWFAELRGTLPLTDGGQRSRQPRTYAAPSSAVLSGLYDLAGASAATDIAARIGGAVATCFDSGSDPGGGNFSNAAFTMGARAGASLFFNGDIYCLAARGAATNDTLIAQMEQWANGRMGRVY